MVAYSFQKRFAEPILVGLGERRMHTVVPKRQTIRAVGKRRHARPGEVIQLYTGMRTKQCRKLGEAICKRVEPIRIHLGSGIIETRGDAPVTYLTPRQLDEFARLDGFPDWPEMREFWLEEHRDVAQLGPWVGLLITWEPRA